MCNGMLDVSATRFQYLRRMSRYGLSKAWREGAGSPNQTKTTHVAHVSASPSQSPSVNPYDPATLIWSIPAYILAAPAGGSSPLPLRSRSQASPHTRASDPSRGPAQPSYPTVTAIRSPSNVLGLRINGNGLHTGAGWNVHLRYGSKGLHHAAAINAPYNSPPLPLTTDEGRKVNHARLFWRRGLCDLEACDSNALVSVPSWCFPSGEFDDFA
ncbi:hypothetical protein BD779DRAFT_1790973 [Infundibulicybe gibba]|nr:hypothetical protein BD779DRAFT_1790973 [Infundibulicybe gibba]